MAETRDRHRDWRLELALRAEPELTGADQERWLTRLEAEHDNLRASLHWTLQYKDAARALRLVGALWRFWHTRARLAEGRRWIAEALEQDEMDDATVFMGEVGSEASSPDPGLLRRIARLLGALAAVRADPSAGLNSLRAPALRAVNDRAVDTIRRTLGDALFAKAWAEDQGRPVDQVLAQAIVELREALQAVV